MGKSASTSFTAAATIAAAVGTAAVAVVLWTTTMGRKKKKQEEPQPPPSSTLHLYGFAPLEDDPDSSPACIKLMTFFRMAKVEYEYVGARQHKYQKSPRSKVPWVHCASLNQGKPLGDSNVIIDALIAQDPETYQHLDQHLTPDQVAVGTAFKVMMEEGMYWYLVHIRWRSTEWDRCTRPTYFGHLPTFVQHLLCVMVRPKMLRDLKGQGYGLLTEEEVLKKLDKEVSAVAQFLGTKNKYFLGDRVSSFDATVYAYLAVFMQGDWKHAIRDKISAHQNLVDYVKRMRQEFFSELQLPKGK